MNNLIFDIKEFALHDGTGLRTTVFFKGCPLECEWCHNPEGQSFDTEYSKNESKCRKCGICKRGCTHKECKGLPFCLKVCPENCIKTVGRYYSPSELAGRLLENERFLRRGGVTFSGGEPLCHVDYIEKLLPLIPDIRVAVETCGYVKSEDFKRALALIDDFYMDIKLVNDVEHIKYTKKSNAQILQNAKLLLESNKNPTFRVPLIPGVTDTDENLNAVADFLSPYSHKVKVELIPYNVMTGAKYASIGREYHPSFDEKAKINKNTQIFKAKNIDCTAY